VESVRTGKFGHVIPVLNVVTQEIVATEMEAYIEAMGGWVRIPVFISFIQMISYLCSQETLALFKWVYLFSTEKRMPKITLTMA